MKKMAKLAMTVMFFLFAFGIIVDNPAYAAESFSLCGPSGGLGGNNFHDGQTGGRRIKEVRIYSGAYIDSIQVIYTDQVNQTIAGSKHDYSAQIN